MYEISRILRRIQLVIFINVHRSSCKVPVILFRFLIFFTDKKNDIKFQKLCPLGGELFHVDGQTHTHTHDEANSYFYSFANAPRNQNC
jgi:hypothetical protein